MGQEESWYCVVSIVRFWSDLPGTTLTLGAIRRFCLEDVLVPNVPGHHATTPLRHIERLEHFLRLLEDRCPIFCRRGVLGG
jgi:hypothetical protein